MTSVKYYEVNAFAERPFEGNPGGVPFLDCWIDAPLMQNTVKSLQYLAKVVY